jgi:hypothetical protein
MLTRYPDLVQREVQSLRDWLRSGTESFHTYKMGKTKEFVLSNAIGSGPGGSTENEVRRCNAIS